MKLADSSNHFSRAQGGGEGPSSPHTRRSVATNGPGPALQKHRPAGMACEHSDDRNECSMLCVGRIKSQHAAAAVAVSSDSSELFDSVCECAGPRPGRPTCLLLASSWLLLGAFSRLDILT